MSRRRLAVGALLGAAVSLLACASPWLRLPPRLSACPGPVPSTAALAGGNAVWRDSVRYRGDGVDAAFSLVAEKRGGKLVLVGFDAFGARVFSVTQEGTQVEASSRLGRALAVPPANVLRDWHALRERPVGAQGPFRVDRPECGYTAVFMEEGSRPLGDAPSASPSP